MSRKVVMGCALALLAACQPEVPPVADAGTCGAAGLQGLVGQPASVLQTMKFGNEVRIVRPGMAVTMDYRPDRLNIAIDEAELIVQVNCT